MGYFVAGGCSLSVFAWQQNDLCIVDLAPLLQSDELSRTYIELPSALAAFLCSFFPSNVCLSSRPDAMTWAVFRLSLQRKLCGGEEVALP